MKGSLLRRRNNEVIFYLIFLKEVEVDPIKKDSKFSYLPQFNKLVLDNFNLKMLQHFV